MIYEKIGPVAPHDANRTDNALPPDGEELQKTLREVILACIRDVPHINDYIRIEMYERFPDTDDEDILISTVPDLIVPDQPRTSIMQLGLPTVEEFERTTDLHTQLNYTFPFSVQMEVVDKWDDPDYILPYHNSAEVFMAIYNASRLALKRNRTLGFKNCSHEYLQMVNAGTIEPEDSEGRIHIGDWSLTVKCTDII